MIKQAVVQPKRFGGSSRGTFANPQVHTWSERLQQLSDGLLLAVLFVAPLFMGGRHPLGRVIYVALICLACCTWLLAQLQQPENARRWSPLGALWLAVAALGLVFLQLVPLPAAVVQFLAPGSTEILPYWSTSGDRDTWSTLSMSPAYGRSGLAMGTGFVLLACLIYQRINSAADARWLLKWIAISTVWFAVLGMLQYLFGNGKFMWVYEHPARDTALVVRGPFQNQIILGN